MTDGNPSGKRFNSWQEVYEFLELYERGCAGDATEFRTKVAGRLWDAFSDEARLSWLEAYADIVWPNDIVPLADYYHRDLRGTIDNYMSGTPILDTPGTTGERRPRTLNDSYPTLRLAP